MRMAFFCCDSGSSLANAAMPRTLSTDSRPSRTMRPAMTERPARSSCADIRYPIVPHLRNPSKGSKNGTTSSQELDDTNADEEYRRSGAFAGHPGAAADSHFESDQPEPGAVGRADDAVRARGKGHELARVHGGLAARWSDRACRSQRGPAAQPAEHLGRACHQP